MKDLEKIFKDSLSNHEVPYDASAWTALSSKMAVKPKPFYKKGWFYGAVAGAAIIITGVTYFTGEDTVISESANVKKEIAKNDHHLNTENGSKELVPVTTENLNIVEEEVSNTNSNKEESNQGYVTSENTSSQTNEEKIKNTEASEVPVRVEVDPVNTVSSIPMNANFTLDNGSVCLGSTVKIQLPVQDTEVKQVLFIDNKRVALNGKGRVIEYKTEKPGLVEVAYSLTSKDKNESLSKVRELTVVDLVDADIQYSTTTENGMPLTEFTTEGKKVTWRIDDKIVSNENTFKHLFMNRGTYEVSLTTENAAGCMSTSTVSVFIESNYRLFAETGLVLSSSDQRLNSFMPFALEEMDKPDFLLSVLDARTGEILFTSNDVSYKWDGTNRTTGNKLEAGSIVFWTVIIKGNKYISGPIKGDITIQN